MFVYTLKTKYRNLAIFILKISDIWQNENLQNQFIFEFWKFKISPKKKNFSPRSQHHQDYCKFEIWTSKNKIKINN